MAVAVATTAADRDADKARKDAAKPAGRDAVYLADGSTLIGKLIDADTKSVVLETAKGKKFLPRSEVEGIDREADPEKLARFQKLKGTAQDADGWRKAAAYCKENGLHPEYRACMRGILRFEPESEEAHVALGKARLDGKWLPEREVEARKASGYVVRSGRLVKPRTKLAEIDKPGDHIKILTRARPTERQLKKIEREREKRDKNLAKYMAKLEKERKGGPWNKRHRIRSRRGNFRVHCNSTRELAMRYAELMEIIRAKLASMFGGKVVRNQPSDVFIYANQEDFLSNDSYARWRGRGLGGYYIPSRGSITAFHGTFGFTGTTFGVLCHEGTHYYQGLLLQGGFDNIPIWLIEGMAVYFGDGSKFDARRKRITVGLIPRDRLTHIQEKIEHKKHTPLKKLVRMTRRTFSGSHYADSWALIYFLVNGSKHGEKFMQAYWSAGVERPLKDEDFTTLAEHYFGSVDEMEKQYLDYITKLEPPSAGDVQGEYFVSDVFQFEYKAPSPEWKFFEDKKDKRLLVGLLLPNTSARIKVYYWNNHNNAETDEYFEAYLKGLKATDQGDVKHVKVEIAGRTGYRLEYVDPGLPKIQPPRGKDGKIDKEAFAKELKEKARPKEVIRYMLIQKDGVASIECSAATGLAAKYRDVFDRAHENFFFLLTRRW